MSNGEVGGVGAGRLSGLAGAAHGPPAVVRGGAGFRAGRALPGPSGRSDHQHRQQGQADDDHRRLARPALDAVEQPPGRPFIRRGPLGLRPDAGGLRRFEARRLHGLLPDGWRGAARSSAAVAAARAMPVAARPPA